MKKFSFELLALLLFFWASCTQKEVAYFTPDNELIRYEGRIDLSDNNHPVLIGSASYIEVGFVGDSCTILLEKRNTEADYNFISLELDGQYLGRLKIEKEGMQAYPVQVEKGDRNHNLKIYKATEAANGTVVFGGIKAYNLKELSALPERKIEFIGNSITCGMGIDWKEIPCHTGPWYDQHNAYFAYGPTAAKALNARFMLSSVSGIGIYRNWNNPAPVMPDVYENMYLNTDSVKKWDFNRYSPDLVSICLGTNDFSDGDGKSERLPFDPVQYVTRYIAFVQTIYSHYPDVQICLLTSPMVSGEKAALFEKCLTEVKEHFDKADQGRKEIALYCFKDLEPHGCDYHPDKEDQEEMAKRLVPFYKEIMEW